MPEDHESRSLRASEARLAAYRRVGKVSEDVLAPIIGPLLTGGPAWPTRPAWRTIRRDRRLMVISDALSDPWEEQPGAGYGIEVFMETADALVSEDAQIGEVAGTWLFSAVQETSNTVAAHGGVRELLDELGAISLELTSGSFPARLRNDRKCVGVLLGTPANGVPATVSLPEGDVRLVGMTLLTRAELDFVAQCGDVKRREFAERLAACPTGHLSSFRRPSLI